MRVADLMQKDVRTITAEASVAELVQAMADSRVVRDLMTPDPYVIGPDADVREAARHMLYGDVRRLFVEDQGRLVGVISQTDIAHAVGTGRI